jgi:small subunit ribosomal protein S8
MSIDAIGNFLTIIRNGVMVHKRTVTAQHSMLKQQIAEVLKQEGYIKDFAVEADGEKRTIKLFLKYVNGETVIHEITRISKPSRRYFERKNNLTSVVGGLGISILTTNQGVLTDQKARTLNVGGEVICHVW